MIYETAISIQTPDQMHLSQEVSHETVEIVEHQENRTNLNTKPHKVSQCIILPYCIWRDLNPKLKAYWAFFRFEQSLFILACGRHNSD